MAKENEFNEQYFLKKGFVPDGNGGFNPPKFINPLVEAPNKPNLILKQKVNDSTSFDVHPVTEWFIPYQVPSKKNSRRNFINSNGKQTSIPSERYAKYKKTTSKYWEVFGIEFNQTMKRLNISFPVVINMTFVRSTNQVIDYFGPGESVFDLMSYFGWWPDDNSRYSKPEFGDIEVNKSSPGVRIKLITNK